MQRSHISLFALMLLLLGSGCVTSQFTNLTPTQLERTDDGVYPFEVAYTTRQRTVEKDSIEAFVVIGEEFFPMKQTEMVEDRWETLIPVDPLQNKIYYRYKLEYWFKAIPDKQRGSSLSDPYELEIID